MIVGNTFLVTIYKGVSYEKSFTYRASGLPVDLTGKIVEFHLRKRGETNDFLNFDSSEAPTSNGSQLSIISAIAGTFQLHIADEETDAFDFELGDWWIGIKEAGKVKRIGGGPVSVELP